MSVHYKFKSSKEFDTLALDGVHISLGDLKEAIIQQKRLGKGQAYDLKITNAETKEVYTDEKTLIPKNSSLIVARVPIDPSQMKKPWETKDATALLLFNPSNLQSTEDAAQAAEIDRKIKEVTDLTKLDGSEEDKIITMMAQSTLDYHPSRYVKLRNSNMAGNVPKEYKCYKCHQYGHWVSMCPLNNQDLRKSTGIPSKFLKEVTDPNTPGVMITPAGKFVISLLNAEEENEDRPTPTEKPPPSEELLCSLCKELMRDAVIISCCTDAFCDDCIRNRLLESEEHECPSCKEKGVGPDTLIPTRYLRIKCMQYDKYGILVPSKMDREPISAIPQYVVRAENTPTPPRSPAPPVSNIASPKSPSPAKSPVPQDSPVITDAVEEKDVSVDVEEPKPEESPERKPEEDSDKENKEVQPQSPPKTTSEPVEETPKEEEKEEVKDDKKEEGVEEPAPPQVEETVQQRKSHKKKKKQKHSHSRHHEEDDEGGGVLVSKGRRRKSRQSKEEEDRYPSREDHMDKPVFVDPEFRKSRSRTPSPSRKRDGRRDRSDMIHEVNPNPRNTLDEIYEPAKVPEFNPNVPPPNILRTSPKDQFFQQPPHMRLVSGIPPRPSHTMDDGFHQHHPPGGAFGGGLRGVGVLGVPSSMGAAPPTSIQPPPSSAHPPPPVSSANEGRKPPHVPPPHAPPLAPSTHPPPGAPDMSVPPPVLGHPPPSYPPQVPPYREMEVVDDPLAAFQKHLREKDERDRLRKARKRSYSRSPTPRSKGWSPRYHSRSRSRPKSFSRSPSHNRSTRRASPFSPESSRRRWSRSPHDSPNLASVRSRRRSRSRSGSFSRQRSPSLSSSPGSARRKTSPFTARPIYRDTHSPNSNRSRPADEWCQQHREEFVPGSFRGGYVPPVEEFYQQPYGDRFDGHPRFGKQGPEQAFDGRHYNGPGEFDGRGRGMRGRRGGDRGGRGRGRGRGGPGRLMDEMPPQPIVPHPPHPTHPPHPPHIPHPSQLPHPPPQHPYNPHLMFDGRMQHPAPSHDDHRDYMDGQRGYPPDIRRGFEDPKLPRGIDGDRRNYQDGRDGRRGYPDERRRGIVDDDPRARRGEEERRRYDMEEGRRKFSDEELQRRRDEDERFRKGGSDHRRGGGSTRRDYNDIRSEDQRHDRRDGDRRGDERDRRSGEDRDDRHAVDERRIERGGEDRRIDDRRGDERRSGDERRNTGDERRGDDERKGDRRGGVDSRRSDERRGVEDRRGNEEKRSGRYDARRDEGHDRKRDIDRNDYTLMSKNYDSPSRNRRVSPYSERKEKEKESSRKDRHSDRRGKETDRRDRDHSKKGKDSEPGDKERHGDRDDVGSRERERDSHKSHERGNSQTKTEDKEEKKRKRRKEKGPKDGRKSSSREKDLEQHESGNEDREEKAEKKKDKKRKKKEKRRDSQTSNDGSQVDISGDEGEKKKRKRRERKVKKDKVRISENAEAEWAAETGEMEIAGKEKSAPVEDENPGSRLLETLPTIQRTPVYNQDPSHEGNEEPEHADSVKEEEPVETLLPVDVHVPELSRWERDEETTPTPKALASSKTEDDEKKVTTEVLKRAENALFSKGMSGRGLTQRKVYLDQQKQRETEVRSPTPEWEKAETREAKRRGPSIQITISSKFESQIGRPRLSRNNEPSSELADRFPARDRLGPKLDLADEKSVDDRRPQSPRNSRNYRKDDLHIHHREMDRRRSRSRSGDRRNRDRHSSRSPSPRSRRGSSLNKSKRYDDQNGHHGRSTSKETEIQSKKGKKRDLSTDEEHDNKKIKNEETIEYNEPESTAETLKTDLVISKGVLEDIVKMVTPPLVPTVNEAYLASISGQNELGTINGACSTEIEEEVVKAEIREEGADVQSNNEHTDLANEFKPSVESPSLSNPEHFPGLDIGPSTVSLDQSFALDDNIALPEPTIRRRFSPILPPSSPKPSVSDVKGKAKEKLKALKRKRRKHSSSSSSSSESSSSSSDSSSEDDDKKKKKKKRKKKKKKKYASSSDSSDNEVKSKKKKKKEKKKKKKKEKKKKTVKKE
ncbi:something that sticks like glue isoform X2 [Oratosquilla oratoria]|uniref:something that sticks like glue isoform X2 n=1 Tax=Oratosquilla oratoria TaxID=337810 RepID=UPI003F76B5B3